jgi:hypothetical protein
VDAFPQKKNLSGCSGLTQQVWNFGYFSYRKKIAEYSLFFLFFIKGIAPLLH